MSEDSAALITLLIFVFFAFIIGIMVGDAIEFNLVKNRLCSAVYHNTNDYLNCKEKSIDEVIKKISEVE